MWGEGLLRWGHSQGVSRITGGLQGGLLVDALDLLSRWGW